MKLIINYQPLNMPVSWDHVRTEIISYPYQTVTRKNIDGAVANWVHFYHLPIKAISWKLVRGFK